MNTELHQDISEPNPGQVASWFSLIFYAYYDGLIRKAFKTPHLKLDELPPLSDFERSKYLSQKTAPVRMEAASLSFILKLSPSTSTRSVRVVRGTLL